MLFFTVLPLPCIFCIVILFKNNENKPMDELLQVECYQKKVMLSVVEH